MSDRFKVQWKHLGLHHVTDREKEFESTSFVLLGDAKDFCKTTNALSSQLKARDQRIESQDATIKAIRLQLKNLTRELSKYEEFDYPGYVKDLEEKLEAKDRRIEELEKLLKNKN